MERISEASPLRTARLGGLFWLLTALAGTLSLLTGGTVGMAANLVATACYVAATIFVYLVLKPVNGILSLTTAIFSILGCAIGVGAAIFHLKVSNLPTLFFGLHCFLVGYLILNSAFLPRFVGVLMVLAGLGWLTQGFARLLSPTVTNFLSFYPMTVGIFGEVTLTFWLLIKGVNVERWKEQAGLTGRQI